MMFLWIGPHTHTVVGLFMQHKTEIAIHLWLVMQPKLALAVVLLRVTILKI